MNLINEKHKQIQCRNEHLPLRSPYKYKGRFTKTKWIFKLTLIPSIDTFHALFCGVWKALHLHFYSWDVKENKLKKPKSHFSRVIRVFYRLPFFILFLNNFNRFFTKSCFQCNLTVFCLLKPCNTCILFSLSNAFAFQWQYWNIFDRYFSTKNIERFWWSIRKQVWLNENDNIFQIFSRSGPAIWM